MNKFYSIICIFLFTVPFFANSKWTHNNISKAHFALDVKNRIPIDIIEAEDEGGIVDVKVEKIFFYTNIRNLKGHTISHRWLFDGDEKAVINFNIKGNRWRVWSSKNMWYKWQGLWTVQVVKNNEEVIFERDFYYEK